jgi:hypothetical protein
MVSGLKLTSLSRENWHRENRSNDRYRRERVVVLKFCGLIVATKDDVEVGMEDPSFTTCFAGSVSALITAGGSSACFCCQDVQWVDRLFMTFAGADLTVPRGTQVGGAGEP